MDKFLNRIYSTADETAINEPKNLEEEEMDKINHLDMSKVEEELHELEKLEKLSFAQNDVQDTSAHNKGTVNTEYGVSTNNISNANDDVETDEISKLTDMLTNLKKQDVFDDLEKLKEFGDDLSVENDKNDDDKSTDDDY